MTLLKHKDIVDVVAVVLFALVQSSRKTMEIVGLAGYLHSRARLHTQKRRAKAINGARATGLGQGQNTLDCE